MLLSDRDIRAEIHGGRVRLQPYDEAMVQPSSIDVRLDKYFRLFDNHKYPFIDPAEDQPDLTHLVEVEPDEPFILHPGEFVLASSFEVVTLPDDLAARLEGKSSLGRLGLLTHSTAGFVSMRCVRSGWSSAGSMNGYLWLSNRRKKRSRRTSMLDGWIMSRSSGSRVMRPASSSARMSRSLSSMRRD